MTERLAWSYGCRNGGESGPEISKIIGESRG